MKLLFFSYAYPNPLHPDLATFNRTMIAGLAADHEVRVVSPVPFMDVWKGRLRGKLPRGLNDKTFSAVPEVKTTYLTSYYIPKLFREQFGRSMWWSVKREFNRVMKEFRPDLVLSYWAHPDGEVAVRMAHQHSVPAVTMVGGSDVLVLGRSGPRRQAILNVLHHADGIITVSDHIAATMAMDGIDRTKVHVIRRGVDRSQFSPGDRLTARRNLGLPEDEKIIIAVGRLVPVKGFKHLIDACAQLKERGRPARCYILGDGELREELQSQINRLGLQDLVQLRGGIPQSELVEWYRAANLTALSSLSEGVPNVLLESIACGTPIVATRVGGVPEIVDLAHDRLVSPEDPTAMADAIRSQLESDRTRMPVRCFEPLGLRGAARRLTQVLEQIHSETIALRPDWKDFNESTPCAAAKASTQLVDTAIDELPDGTSLAAASPDEAEAFLSQLTESTTSKDIRDVNWNSSENEGDESSDPLVTQSIKELVPADSEGFSRPQNGTIEEVLGRTGEAFVFPVSG